MRHCPYAPAARARLALAALVFAAALPVQAAGGGTLVVSATVLSKNVCKFSVTAATLSFTIDPSSTGAATASADFVFSCKGSSPVATWSISADDGAHPAGAGARRMQHASDTNEHIAYSLNLPAGGSVPKNVDYTFTVTGTIAPAAFQDAIAGSYSDTVTLTLTP